MSKRSNEIKLTEHGATENGAFDRRTDVHGWWVPGNVECSEDRLQYSYENGREINPTGNLLERFIRLHRYKDAGFPAQVKRYTEQWGTLEICRHGYPASHSRPTTMDLWDKRCGPVSVEGESDRYTEPLVHWRKYSSQFEAIVTVANKLHSGSKPNPEVWKGVWEDADIGMRHRDWKWNRTWLFGYLSRIINRHLCDGDVRPVFDLGNSSNKPRFRLASGGLFGYLAIQLAYRVSSSEGGSVCSSCGEPFALTSRRPRRDQRSYCQRCRKEGAPQRDAMRDLRLRKAAAREVLHAGGD